MYSKKMMILNERVISPWMKRVTFQDSDYSKIASFYYPVFFNGKEGIFRTSRRKATGVWQNRR